MIPTDENFIRWFTASVNTYFATAISGYAIFFEESDATKDQSKPWCEIRINGPRWNQPSKGWFNIQCEINIMCNVLLGADGYEVSRVAGKISNKMSQPISIKKYGNDESLIGCLTLRRDVENPIDVVQWGKPTPDLKVMQMSVDGYFEMTLQE